MSVANVIRWETWVLSEEADRRFRRIALIVGLPILILAIIVPFIHYEVTRTEHKFEAKRYVTLLPPKPVEPPKPIETPKPVEQAKPLPQPKPEPKPLPKQARRPSSPPKAPAPPRPQPSAREQAQKALANVTDELADLRDQNLPTLSTAPAYVTPNTLTSNNGGISAGQLAASAAANSGGIGYTGRGVTGDGSGPGVGTHRTGAVNGGRIGHGGGGGAGAGEGGMGGRDRKEIQEMFDRHQSTLYALYRHARLQNDSLAGTVFLSITIAADGTVTDCHVSSSELGDPELERQVVELAKSFHFRPKKVESFTYPNYPIAFHLPS